MLEQFKFYFLPSLINFIGIIYIQHKILKKNISFKQSNFYIAMVLFLVLNIFNYLYIDGFVRMLSNTLVIILVSYIIFKAEINKIFGAVVLEQIMYFFGELVVAFILLMIGINADSISYDLINFTLLNIAISVVAILLYHIPLINNLIDRIMKFLNNFNNAKKYILIFVFFITLNFLIMLIYFSSGNRGIILINIIFIGIYSVVMFCLMNEKNENIKYRKENEILLDNLNEYEKMLDYQRVNNHENKNQLLVIRSMISKNNKKALEYLDEIITEKRKDDEGLYAYAKIIPSGGLQGLIYQKMICMKENNIDIKLNIDKQIRKLSIDNISSKENYDLCRAVGLILDNAIDETKKLKDKEILIFMYKEDNQMVIEVSNRCQEIPDLSKIDEKGYTTKSDGHGYGLCLLKQIVEKNNNITNIRNINKDIFTQIIKIKM